MRPWIVHIHGYAQVHVGRKDFFCLQRRGPNLSALRGIDCTMHGTHHVTSILAGPSESVAQAELDDDMLVRFARTGHFPAIDALSRRHQTRALNIATRYLGDPNVTRDVAQSGL